MNKKKRAKLVLERLKERYPHPQSNLQWTSPWELLVATVLATQCTDERVNIVLPDFFEHYPSIDSLAEANIAEVEQIIRSTGLYRNKAKNLVQSAKILVDKHNSQVPDSMQELLALPGVARKTANIILYNAFNKNEGVAVDTHVKRLSFRLGFTDSQNQQQIEKDLMQLFDREYWGMLNHLLVFYGRDVCKARNPQCQQCEFLAICPQQGLAS